MHKRKKWVAGIGALTLVGTTGLMGCNPAPKQEEANVQMHNAMTHAVQMNQAKAGEGEGEGEGATVHDLGTDDLAYLTQLALMRGHLYMGYELYQAGHIEHAKTHMKHPESELYADAVPAFEARHVKGFAQELKALADAVETGQDKETVSKAYEALQQAIRTSEAAVAKQSDKDKLKLVVALLRVAGEEYAIAVVDGKLENAHEYQDALGFTTIAKMIATELDNSAANKAQVIALIAGLQMLWPDIVPPEVLGTEAGQLYGAAAKIELLALGM